MYLTFVVILAFNVHAQSIRYNNSLLLLYSSTKYTQRSKHTTTIQHTADETRAFVAGICKESNFPIYGIIPQVLAHACDNLFEYFGAQLTDGIRDSECMHCMRPSASMG